MPVKHCWLCVHCDVEEVCEMMKFIEDKSPVMHIDVIAHQVASALAESYPEELDIDEAMVKEHICRHVVTPVASVTRITRDLLDMCETLRPNRETLLNNSGRGKKRAITDGSSAEPLAKQARQDDEMSVTSNTEAADSDKFDGADTTNMYLRTVGQIMGIYRMHAKLMQPQ